MDRSDFGCAVVNLSIAAMINRIQYSTTSVLKIVLWLAVACFVWRVTNGMPIHFGNILYIAAALSFVLVPFAAVGAMFDRLGTGVLVGLVFVVVSAALLKGF